jgi:signal transduction histidine kinase
VSIRARLLLLILFATLVPALAGLFHFVETRDAEVADAGRRLATEAGRVAAELQDIIKGTAQLHYGLSRARDLDAPDRAACSRFLGDVLKAHPQYTGILTINPDGRLFCDSLRTGRDLDLNDRRYFRESQRAADAVAVEPVFGRLTGIAVMQVAYAARSDGGELRFVLLASVNLEQIMSNRAKTLPMNDAVIALVDSGGTVLSWQPGGEKLRGTSIADTPLFRFAMAQGDNRTQAEITAGGVSRLWAVSALPDYPEAGLRVLVGVSRKGLFEAANRNLGQSLLVMALVLLAAFIGAWALSELGVRRQIARISHALNRFSGGDFDARIGKPYPGGEIGGLMAAIDRDFGLIQEQRDIINRLNADLERRVAERTAELEAANKELESFCYSVSHDLRMPLRHIDGYIGLLEKESGGRLSAEASRYLQVVAEASRNMGRLIDDLLAFSRMGREELREDVVDLGLLVKECIEFLGSEIQGRNIVWKLSPLPAVRGDRAMLRQVFANLLGNAVKYTGPRDPAEIEVGCTGEAEDRHVICVRDNGVGFDMQYAGKLFGVFQRMHRADQFEGTGIGLANVRRIISRHGGRVWAESEEERGAAFYFTLRPA